MAYFSQQLINAITLGAIYGLIAARLVTPTRIDDHFVWLRGACGEYLSELPEWPYGPK